MTFEEAIRKSIKSYMKGTVPEALGEVKGGIKYDLKFFDKIEEMFLEDQPKKGKKKAERDEDIEMEEM